jgi:hypothetical protein
MEASLPSAEEMADNCDALQQYQHRIATATSSSGDGTRDRDDDDDDDNASDDDDEAAPDDVTADALQDQDNDDDDVSDIQPASGSTTPMSVSPNFEVLMKCVELEMACFLEEAVSRNKEYQAVLQTSGKPSTNATTHRNKILEKSVVWGLNPANTRFICQLLYSAFKLAKPDLRHTNPMAEFLFGLFDNLFALCVEPFTRLTLDGRPACTDETSRDPIVAAYSDLFGCFYRKRRSLVETAS